ncbi:MAG: monofunctional biosynthetic peptidoglycan transglycosylase [Pseudomonadaceae bacterium]|nr:monofunctional biosynthetic peptidoglycan transglycosylase [Pseudomonadaceae bacterium]
MPNPLPLWKRGLALLRRWAWNALLTVAILIPLLLVLYIWAPVPATPLMVWRLANGYGWERTRVPLSDIPEIIPRAVVASEDNRFCEHNGVDWKAVNTVLTDWLDGGRLRGASTITMQTAKNVFLWPNQDVVRKALELPLAYAVDTLWGKQRVMEVYLNVAEWGPGVYGIGAAAEYHFGRPLWMLNRDEIYRLVAILPAPLRWKANRPAAWPRQRAITLRTRVEQVGKLPCL